jgi:hypothetical protein
MDPRFRWDDQTEAMETLADDILSRVRVAIPVKLAKDSDGHTVSLQPLIKGVQRTPDGALSLISLPMLSDVPIQHGGGGGMTITHPHKADDEGVFLVSHRGFDAWHQQGGEQPAIDARTMSLSDGFYLPNVRSTPRKLDKVSTTSTQVRSDDGKHVSDWNPTTGSISHSVENGRHVTSMTKDGGISHSAFDGKHVTTMGKDGITIKTAMALAMDASKGLNVKGAMAVDGKVTSTKPIGGSVAAGILGGGIGALIGAIAVLGLLANAYGPSQGVQTVRYALNAAWVR